MLINPPTWTQNGTYTAEQDRRLVGALVRSEGVVNISSMVPKVISGSRQVSISDGGAYIHGDYAQAGGGGTYFVHNDGAHEVAIPVAGTLDRYDLIVLRIYDSAVSGSVNEARFDVVSGTPAVSPRIPAVPRSSIPIAAVKVNAKATQLLNASLTDQRVIAQMNGTVTGKVTKDQETRLNQVASPTNPLLITSSSNPDSLQMSTGGGFRTIGSSEIVAGHANLPKTAPEGAIVTYVDGGRTYQMREGKWRFFHGWGPYITLGRVANATHSGGYCGGLIVNPGTSADWAGGVPVSSADYATHFSINKGVGGSDRNKGGYLSFKTPGMYHIETRYDIVGLRNNTDVITGTVEDLITNNTKVDNGENRHRIQKGQDLRVSASSTLVVNTRRSTPHGKLYPYLKTSSPVKFDKLLMRVELTYEF